MEDGFSTVCVFLDLAKAFDSVPNQSVIDAFAGSGMYVCVIPFLCGLVISQLISYRELW